MRTGFIILVVLCWLLILMGDSRAEYMPWDTVGIQTNAPLDVVVPVPYDRGATNYRIWQNGRVRWGWIETEPSGDWRQYDSDSGWNSGRVEIER